jgi:regulatory NSL complex subunit 3
VDFLVTFAVIRRKNKWEKQNIPVTMHTVNGSKGVGISQCLEHMVGAVHTKVLEVLINVIQ